MIFAPRFLSLQGDMITIMRKFTDGWCEGELNGKKGVFPSNYVTDLAPPEEPDDVCGLHLLFPGKADRSLAA